MPNTTLRKMVTCWLQFGLVIYQYFKVINRPHDLDNIYLGHASDFTAGRGIFYTFCFAFADYLNNIFEF